MRPSGLISDRMTDIIIRRSRMIILICILLGAGFGILIPFSVTDPEIRNYVPATMKSRVQTDRIEDEFGVQDMVIILFSDSCILDEDNLLQIRSLDRAISRLPGITSRISPFTVRTIKSLDGSMIADKLIIKTPSDSVEVNELKRSISGNRYVEGVVFSSDLSSASITAFLDSDIPETETLSSIDSILSSFSGRMSVSKGGMPYIRRYIMDDVRKDALKLVPLALLIMLLILKLTLKSWSNVLMPFSVVIISTLISMGLLPLLGWKMSIMTLLVPVIMVAVANNYGIYLTSRYQEIRRNEPDITQREVISRLLHTLNMPILFSALTTIAGILGLLAHSVIPARQVGILAAAGVTAALAMSLLLIPSMINVSGSKEGKLYRSGKRKIFFEGIDKRLSDLIINHNGKILAITAMVTILLSGGIFMLKIDTNQENFFPEKHPVKISSRLINEKFGGSQTISVMVSGDIFNPQVMSGIDSITETLAQKEGVGNVYSISLAVREISKAIFTKNEEGYNSIPGTRAGIAQMFELYYMSGDQNDFRQLINTENTKAHILIKLSDAGNANIKAVKTEITALSGSFPASIITGGYAIIMDDFAGKIISGQASSLALALITVFLLMSLVFKSIRGGLTGSIPLAVSIILVFGFMGITGIALDAATALLSSIMIGVGVDFTIQYIWCFNLNFRKGLGYVDATKTALRTIGRSIIINALGVMAGFSVLMFSGFMSIRFFGYLVFISIGSCLLGAILIIPSFIMRFRPSFIEKSFSSN